MQVIMSPGRKIGKTLGEKEKGEIALYVVGTIGTESNAFDARFKHTCKIYLKTFIQVIHAVIIWERHGSRSQIPC